MIFDTNLIIKHIRKSQNLPSRIIIPMPVVGELKAFALKSDWGIQKVLFMNNLFNLFPLVEITEELTEIYAQTDAYSQGRLQGNPLPLGVSARNMGKNDLWIATTALYFDLELHTTDNDFDHLINFGLKLIKHLPS
ncbi:tRNA(fMet)-specific endonuclease VapC [Arcicella aurantiaca]|uniref:tRNA(fMet)-specific endonuclease VapC n=1 Tax=Arcicella aurantiaca TaxID=591202 RepID=A0A316ECB2_9BACT|nr:PIN domain-containing protein [Arcicella aurantiaca]PWK27780.1 tRNA(fMet)-specific endonuclease VapC [Arcicella aurantiaca]